MPMLLTQVIATGDPPRVVQPDRGCAWWNLACKGGHEIANAGLSAITQSIASGGEMLLGQIVKYIDAQTAVPLADPTYRHVYYGFLGLAAPLVGVVLCIALVLACVRRDPGTLVRAGVGVGVAALGGAFYIVLAQLLVALDDWLAHGVVRVTGHSLTDSINELAVGFHHVAGAPGEIAANMLLILLMGIMLIAGLILWFVLVLRKVAILVVVAFAPLLIVGYLWTPTRAWVRRATEVLIALVFTKTAIFTLFGIGLSLLSRGSHQSLGDFVGSVVLMCGACFAPMLLLRLVHFAADSHLAGDAMATLHGGIAPITRRLPGSSAATGPTLGRREMADSQGQAVVPPAVDPIAEGPSPAGGLAPGSGGVQGAAAGANLESAGAGAGAGAASASGAAGVAVVGAKKVTDAATDAATNTAHGLASATDGQPGADPSRHHSGVNEWGRDPADRPLAGPTPPAAPDPQPGPPDHRPFDQGGDR